MSHAKFWTTAAASGALFALAFLGATPAIAASGDHALSFANAITADPANVVGSSFAEQPPTGFPTAVMTMPLSSFPQAGDSFAVLSTGDAGLAATANTSGSSGASNGGPVIRGGALDAVVLAVKVRVPSGRNCARVDFRFLSEEYPEYVGSYYNDAFLIELDKSTWQIVSGRGIQAPDNFAFDPTGSPITINATGATSMSAADAAGTTYDGATPLLTAAVPITAGEHTFYFSIFDQGDSAFDSAAFIDNLRFSSVSDPATNCRQGAKPSAKDTAVPLLGAHGITGDPKDMDVTLSRAKALVPSLRDTRSSTTGKIASVWANGQQIADDAAAVTAASGQPRVNVIAHSKGGLDARVAMVPSLTHDRAVGVERVGF